MNTSSDVDPSRETGQGPAPQLHPSGQIYRMGPLLVLLLAGVGFISALSLPFGSVARPGPGLWPAVVAAITMVLALGALTLPRQDEEDIEKSSLKRVTILFVAVLTFPFLFDLVGFVIPSFALIVFIMRFLSRESWLRTLIVAAATTTIAYFLFGVMLGIRLPAFF